MKTSGVLISSAIEYEVLAIGFDAAFKVCSEQFPELIPYEEMFYESHMRKEILIHNNKVYFYTDNDGLYWKFRMQRLLTPKKACYK